MSLTLEEGLGWVFDLADYIKGRSASAWYWSRKRILPKTIRSLGGEYTRTVKITEAKIATWRRTSGWG